jgi:hypothetical protein
MQKFMLALFSAPFFIAGFIWSFVCQGFEDGKCLEKGLREYFKGIK